MLTLTDDKLLKFVLIWGKSCVVFVWGEKLGWPRTPFIILLKGTRYFKASDFASFGKNEDKTTLSKPAKTSKVLNKTWTNFSMVGQVCR